VSRAVEIDELRAEKQTVEQRLAELRSKVSEDESQNADAMVKLKNSIQLAENAVAERDQVWCCRRCLVISKSRPITRPCPHSASLCQSFIRGFKHPSIGYQKAAQTMGDLRAQNVGLLFAWRLA